MRACVCAQGVLRVRAVTLPGQATHPLDDSRVHRESYDIAVKMAGSAMGAETTGEVDDDKLWSCWTM